MKLATQIILGFLIAISIDLLDSFVNYRLTLRVKTVSGFLDRSEMTVRYSSDLNKNLMDMQSAFRGFLLTGDSAFLSAFNHDAGQVDGNRAQLQKMISTYEQRLALDSISRLYKSWLAAANALIAVNGKLSSSGNKLAGRQQNVNDYWKSRLSFGYNRRLSDFFVILDEVEYARRDLRRKELAAAIRQTDIVSIVFSISLVLIGLGIAFFLVRKITRRIGPLVHLAEKIAQGDFGKVSDNKRDELSSLSSSLNLMSEKLSRTIGELERKNAELNRFAYVVSHDLKAPVRGISNVVRWLEEDHANEISLPMRKYLDFIPDRIKRIERLIDGLLEYARADRTGWVSESVDVNDLVADITDLIVPDGYIVLTGGLPVLSTEKVPLQQVLSNLIGNAVQYGPAGSTVITISCADHGAYCEFTVQDNGPGIDPDYHEKIFGLFQTLRLKESPESTGIGLAIVRKIVEERGGFVRIVSAAGEGAKFIFTWPKN